jgi:cytochrome b
MFLQKTPGIGSLHTHDPEASMNAPQQVKVWDPLVRIFHWALVLAFFTAYLTEDEWLTLHVWAGYTVLGLIGFRILWGFIGPRHARFSDFVYAPSETLSYIKDLLRFRNRRYLGHNPAGSVMIFVLLVVLLLTLWGTLILYIKKLPVLTKIFGWSRSLLQFPF